MFVSVSVYTAERDVKAFVSSGIPVEEFDRVEGRFTQKDGKVRVLAGGRGTMSVRQWHAYPSILPRELYSDSAGEVSCDTKFDTL